VISWAMMTAPRPVPTIDRSLASFRKAGFRGSVIVVEDTVRDGPLFTWRRTMETMLERSKFNFIGIMQDDILWARKSCSVLAKEMKDMGYRAHEAGYLSLYVFEKHKDEPKAEKWKNWHVSRLGFKSAGAQCYVLPRRSAERLMKNHAFHHFCDHKKNDRKKGDDHVVSGMLRMMGMKCWFRVPGFVSHQMGMGNSAIGHKTNNHDAAWEEVARAIY